MGHAVALLVEALRYKPEGRGSIPDAVIEMFNWHNPSDRTMALGLTQTLTEMSTRNISWGWRRTVSRADNLTTFMCRLSWNLGALTSWSPQGLSRSVMGLLLNKLWKRNIQLRGRKLTSGVGRASGCRNRKTSDKTCPRANFYVTLIRHDARKT